MNTDITILDLELLETIHRRQICHYPNTHNTCRIMRSSNVAIIMVNFNKDYPRFSDLAYVLYETYYNSRNPSISKIHVYVDFCPNVNSIQHVSAGNITNIMEFIHTIFLSVGELYLKTGVKIFIHFSKEQICIFGEEGHVQIPHFIKNKIREYKKYITFNFNVIISDKVQIYKIGAWNYFRIGLPKAFNEERRFSFQKSISVTVPTDFNNLGFFSRVNEKNGEIFQYYKPFCGLKNNYK